jgi:hypothetical protein
VRGQILPINPSHYKVISAPHTETALLGSARFFQWVDSDRVIFPVADRYLSVTEGQGDEIKIVRSIFTLHIWDIPAGTIRRYRSEPFGGRLCAVDGRIRYTLLVDGRTAVFEGPFGSEKQREVVSRHRVDGADAYPQVNSFSCKEYWFSELPRRHDGKVTPLREEDGYLERVASAPRDLPAPSRWMPPFRRWHYSAGNTSEVVFPPGDIGGPLGYSALAGGYLFRKDDSWLSRGTPNTFFLWRPKENTVRTLEVSGSQNWTALYEPRITRVGLIAKSSTAARDPQRKWDPGPAGIYRFYGTEVDAFINSSPTLPSAHGKTSLPIAVEQVVRGLIDAVSPASESGCRIVIVVDPWDRESRRIRLEAIDFCAKQ